MAYGPWLGKTPPGKTLAFGTTAPSASTDTHPPDGWSVGDMIINTAPVADGPFAWVCTTAGTPGTWTAWPNASSAIGISSMRVAHAKYSFAVDGGAQGAITPASTAVIPDNAIIVGAQINSSTAVTSSGSATVAVGTTAGSAANSILTATGKASFTLDAVLNGSVTFAAPVKMTAAGSINITVGTADLTAGVLEIFVFYVVAST